MNPRKETLEKRLEEVASSVLHEVSGLWAADEWHICWFERECSAPLAEGLRKLIKPWSAKARALEIQHLDNPHLPFPHSLTAQGEIDFAAGLQSSYQALCRAMFPLHATRAAKSGWRTSAEQHDRVASMADHREHAAAVPAPGRVLSPGSNVKTNEPEKAAAGKRVATSKRRVGRPIKTESTRSFQAWRDAGEPPFTSANNKLFDSVALELYPKEFENAKEGSKKRNRLRMRVIQSIRRTQERIKTSV